MRYLGIDYGEKRIGLSYSDELGVALPLDAAAEKIFGDRMLHIADIIKNRNITEIVIGMPYNMDGSQGFKAKEVILFIDNLKNKFGLPIHTIDERLTTHQVQSDFKKVSKLKISNKKVRQSGKVDSSAAALILQDYLDQNIGVNFSSL